MQREMVENTAVFVVLRGDRLPARRQLHSKETHVLGDCSRDTLQKASDLGFVLQGETLNLKS